MAMILASATGFLLSDGEMRRVRWIQAMRRCLLRMNGIIRYEQPPLAALLARIDLRSTPQERELTRLLHVCAAGMDQSGEPRLPLRYAAAAAKLAGYGVLSEEDRSAFEGVLAELGRTRLDEQIAVIDHADERLRAREETLSRDGRRRAQLIRTLGFAVGASLFLILV